jgi:hypothetical protein
MSGFVNNAGAREWNREVLGAEAPVLDTEGGAGNAC